ncbi:MAG: LysE family transporter, partial [Bacteroidota bacterium]|nr:LysE family transporter [Bacteroidota bacterium]
MSLFHICTQGILFGLTLSLMIGPAFFSLLQTSISKGFRSGAYLAIGISLSDVIMVFVAWYGVSTFFETEHARKILSIIGGVIIVVFGIYTATRLHKTPKRRDLKTVSRFQFKYLGKGLLFNIANIGTWLYWLIPVSVANSYSCRKEQLIFLVSILLTNLGMDLLKCKVS